MTLLAAVVGVLLVLVGLLYPAVMTSVSRRRAEQAFWEQVRHRPGLFDWAEYPDL